MKDKKETKEITVYTPEYLRQNKNVGMSKVDPIDIRPPEIRLIQKSSELADFKDKNGKQAKIGQFFHTGKMEIYDTFTAYILFAGKGMYTDKRKPEEGKKSQYKAIGALGDDFTIFGLTLRSSYLFALSPLFTATVSLNRPMYSIKVKWENKKLSNDKGEWYIPICRILGEEKDPVKLAVLSGLANDLDQKTSKINTDEIDVEEIDKVFNEK